MTFTISTTDARVAAKGSADVSSPSGGSEIAMTTAPSSVSFPDSIRPFSRRLIASKNDSVLVAWASRSSWMPSPRAGFAHLHSVMCTKTSSSW